MLGLLLIYSGKDGGKVQLNQLNTFNIIPNKSPENFYK